MFKTLCEARTQVEADLMISRLRAAGFHPSDVRVWPHVTFAGANLFYGVEVPAEESELAGQVLGAGLEGNEARLSRPSTTLLRVVVIIVLALIAGGALIP